MAVISSILSAEKQNTCRIQLYPEGLFYKAYEHSAFVACLFLHPFKIKKRFVKCVQQMVVSVGFPRTSLEKWSAGRSVIEEDGKIVIVLKETEKVDIMQFDKWKETVSEMGGEFSLTKSLPIDEMIVMRLRNFPIEQKSPLDCMIFLSELKKLI